MSTKDILDYVLLFAIASLLFIPYGKSKGNIVVTISKEVIDSVKK